jgi:DNA-binding NarL/FixJ family response regulator
VEEEDHSARSEPGYWRERLVQRHYPSLPRTEASQELFVRIQHEDTSQYFPVGTADRDAAAQQASQIYQVIIGQGWASACRRFARELTLAFHWQDNPLIWTYTALHTRADPHEHLEVPATTPRAGQIAVLIAESDAGLRLALADCVSATDGLYNVSTVANAGEALRQAARQPPHLVLANEHLVEWPRKVWQEKLRVVAPSVTGLAYSVHEDSQELFRATPGGASAYLLRRAAPAQILDPLRGVLGQAGLSPREVASSVWQYFRNTFASTGAGGIPDELTSLTQREREVLALLSKGHPHKFIAARLRLSAYTVHGHVRNIFEKLGVHNRVEAVVKYFQK